MATAFPTLSRSIAREGYTEKLAYDPSIKTQAEDGVVLVRARFTTTKKKFSIPYNNLTIADKTLLIAWQNTIMVGGDTVTWTNPVDSVIYTVRLDQPLEFSLVSGDVTKYKVIIEFTEA